LPPPLKADEPAATEDYGSPPADNAPAKRIASILAAARVCA
jgi:hypothetical protein